MVEFSGPSLISDCRLTAEIPDGISDTDMLIWLNKGARRLQAKIYAVSPKWGLKTGDVTVDGSSETYSLASDVYKVRQVFIKGTRIRLSQIDISERAKYTDSSLIGIAQPVYYIASGSQIGILPSGWAGTLLTFYMPDVSTLTTDPASVIELPMGCDDWIVSFVGMQYARRIAEDVSPWLADMDRIWADIRTQITTANAGNALRARNVEGESIEQELLALWL
jgi:hypothetical protein